jgi:hypothetical protein
MNARKMIRSAMYGKHSETEIAEALQKAADDMAKPVGADQPDRDTVTEQVLTGASLDRMSEEGLTELAHPEGVMAGLLGEWDE